MSLTYFSICITEYSLSWTCYSLSITCHSLCERGPGPWVTRFAAIWGSLMDPLLIIHGSVYWIGPLDMWINHSRKTTYITDYEGFRAYLLTVTTDILRFLASSRASPGHRSAASTDNIQTEVAWYTDNVYIPLLYCVLSEDVQCDLCSGVRQECVVDHKIRTPEQPVSIFLHAARR